MQHNSQLSDLYMAFQDHYYRDLQARKPLDQQYIQAAREGKTDEVQRLLAEGAYVHADDDAAMTGAACYGHEETFKVIVNDIARRLREGTDTTEFSEIPEYVFAGSLQHAFHAAAKFKNTKTADAIADYIKERLDRREFHMGSQVQFGLMTADSNYKGGKYSMRSPGEWLKSLLSSFHF